MSKDKAIQQMNHAVNDHMKNEYHIIVLFGEKTNIQVFFEKDQVELNKEKLEELLSLCIK